MTHASKASQAFHVTLFNFFSVAFEKTLTPPYPLASQMVTKRHYTIRARTEWFSRYFVQLIFRFKLVTENCRNC